MPLFDMVLLDWIFVAVLLFSLVVGAWRGLVYEVLSALNWLCAFVLAQWLGPDLAQMLPMSSTNDTVRLAAGFVGVFIAAVFVGGLIARLLKKLVETVGLRPVDRVLGAMFGSVRGVILILVATLLVQMTVFKTNELWVESVGAGVAVAALKGLKPVMPEKLGQYFP
jgi:membrane protein required for colicin V production